MTHLKQVALNFTPEDLALIEALRSKTGISTRIDLIRLSLRKLARDEGLSWPRGEAQSLPK